MGGQLSGKFCIDFFQGIIPPFGHFTPQGRRGDTVGVVDPPPPLVGATDLGVKVYLVIRIMFIIFVINFIYYG